MPGPRWNQFTVASPFDDSDHFLGLIKDHQMRPVYLTLPAMGLPAICEVGAVGCRYPHNQNLRIDLD
jgi:hypothetical protein